MLIGHQILSHSFHNNSAILKDIGPVCHFQTLPYILLDQKDRHSLLTDLGLF